MTTATAAHPASRSGMISSFDEAISILNQEGCKVRFGQTFRARWTEITRWDGKLIGRLFDHAVIAYADGLL